MRVVSIRRFSYCLEDNTKYSLADSNIDDEDVREFTSLLREGTTLKALHISGNNNAISRDVWKFLIQTILCHPSIVHVTLDNNALSYERIRVLAEVIQQYRTMFRNKFNLTISNNNLPVDGFITLFGALNDHPTLEELMITDSKLCCCMNCQNSAQTEQKYQLGQSIRQFLQQNTSLRELYLSNNNWGDIVAKEIAIGLYANTTLLRLYYCSNNLRDIGANAIANALRRNKHLTYLSLDSNRIGDIGAIAIANSLKVNTSLQELYIHCNKITHPGFTALGNALRYNMSLQYLYCSHNKNCTDVATIPLIDALQSNTTLRTLEMNQNIKTDAGDSFILEKVSTALEYNDTITRIECTWPLSSSQTDLLFANSGCRWIRETAPKKGGRVRTDIFFWLTETTFERTYLENKNNNKIVHRSDSVSTSPVADRSPVRRKRMKEK